MHVELVLDFNFVRAFGDLLYVRRFLDFSLEFFNQLFLGLLDIIVYNFYIAKLNVAICVYRVDWLQSN